MLNRIIVFVLICYFFDFADFFLSDVFNGIARSMIASVLFWVAFFSFYLLDLCNRVVLFRLFLS